MSLGLRYLLFVACVASPALAVDVRYGVAVRTDARTRTPLPGDLGTVITGDLEVTPRADLSLGVDASTFSALYAPSFLWREPQASGGRFLPLHRARLAFQTVWSRATFLIAQDGSYGVADVGFLRLPDGSLPSTVAEVQTLGSVPYVRSATLVSLESQPGNGVSLGLTAGFQISGSTDDSQQQQLPLQYGPTAAVRLRKAVTRSDGLTTFGQVSQATFVTGQNQFVAQLSEIWDRQLSRTLLMNLGVGLALTREHVIAMQGIPGDYLDLLPIALASLAWRDVLSGHPLLVTASLRMAPFSDRFTANVYERVEARLQAEWRPAKDWIVTAATGGAYAVPLGLSLAKPIAATQIDRTGLDQSGDRLVFGEGSVVWAVKTWLLLQGSARVLWTEQPRLLAQGQLQAVGTVSVTVQQQDSLAW
ncbi:MAG: hypothetical protein Q8N23_03095 [Archangium sp.]|nr:hypothetical protein [Archangium sp.]MDP3569164.1 hypothetical protein [Archangium sp.]